MLKEGNEDFILDVPDIMSDMLVTEITNQRKDEQVLIGNCEETKIRNSVTEAEENSLDIVSIIQRI